MCVCVCVHEVFQNTVHVNQPSFHCFMQQQRKMQQDLKKCEPHESPQVNVSGSGTMAENKTENSPKVQLVLLNSTFLAAWKTPVLFMTVLC